MVVERPLKGHAVNAVGFGNKSEVLCKLEFDAVHLMQRDAEECFKGCGIHLSTICHPKQVVDHTLTGSKAEGQGGRKFLLFYPFTVFFDGESVNLKLIP